MKAKKINAEHLIADYVRLKKALGRRPTCTEFAGKHHSIGQLCNVFGRPGWRQFLRAAGEPSRPVSAQLEREQVVREFLELKKELGRAPSSGEYRERYHTYGALQRIFGKCGWNNLLMAAGEKPKHRSFITKDMLIQDYRALKKKLGRQPQFKDYQKECYGIGLIAGKFGNPAWRKLLKAAGDAPLVEFNLPAKHLIEDFLNLQKKLGRRPKLMEYTYQCHTPKVLDRVFGKPGWNKLIKAIGAKAMPKDILTAEHLIQDYLETRTALGYEPSQTQFHDRHGHTIKVFVRVFGKPGWSNFQKAVRKAGRKRR